MCSKITSAALGERLSPSPSNAGLQLTTCNLQLVEPNRGPHGDRHHQNLPRPA
jgi:hypothetical protein